MPVQTTVGGVTELRGGGRKTTAQQSHSANSLNAGIHTKSDGASEIERWTN